MSNFVCLFLSLFIYFLFLPFFLSLSTQFRKKTRLSTLFVFCSMWSNNMDRAEEQRRRYTSYCFHQPLSHWCVLSLHLQIILIWTENQQMSKKSSCCDPGGWNARSLKTELHIALLSVVCQRERTPTHFGSIVCALLSMRSSEKMWNMHWKWWTTIWTISVALHRTFLYRLAANKLLFSWKASTISVKRLSGHLYINRTRIAGLVVFAVGGRLYSFFPAVFVTFLEMTVVQRKHRKKN
jgi:hypothetical protein